MSLRSPERLLVRLASLAVPDPYRDRFREEWLSELWHLRDRGARGSEIATRALGVVRDAIATRRAVSSSKEEPSARAQGERSESRSEKRRGWGPSALMKRRRPTLGLHDFRVALRGFWQRPGWTLIVLLTLAVGIGANVAIFGLVRAVLLAPLHYPEPDRLVKIRGLTVATGAPSNISPGEFYDFLEGSTAFESMGAHGFIDYFTVSSASAPERVPGSRVTAGFFETLGVRPALGRIFTEEDDRPGAANTVLLTHSFWMTRLGGSRDAVGRTLRINTEPYEIVGVLPAGYLHPEPNPEREPSLYTLLRFDRRDLCQDCRFIRALGRLHRGRTIEEGRAELAGIALRRERDHPEDNVGRGASVIELKEAIVAGSRRGLLVLYGAVTAVLLIVCANLANLKLAQGVLRQRSLAIQAALGAGRAALVRQLLIESWLLSLAGGCLGLLLAFAGRGAIAQRSIPRAVELDFDGTVLVAMIALSTLTAVAFGLAPALSLSSKSLRAVLVEGGSRGASARSRARGVLIGVEVALSLVLLVGAGLLTRSLIELRSVTPGFDPARVLTMSLSLPLARYEEGKEGPFYQELYQRIGRLPGIRAVGATNILPLSDNYSSDMFQIDDRPASSGREPAAEARSASSGYFDAMGIPLLRGRLFDERDGASAPKVLVISESMAAKFWPGEDPLGARITYNRGIPDPDRLEVGGPGSREIVGIVGDVKHLALDEEPIPMFYTPQPQDPSFHTLTLVVRSSAPAESLVSGISRELAALDPEIPIYSVRTLGEVLDRSVAQERFRVRVLGLFALVALGLAALGVYAVMGLAVAQREREIGIRMALGARAMDVFRMLVLESMKPVLCGVVAGGTGAFFLSQVLRSLLFRIDPRDPSTFAGVALVLALTALLAALVPTMRAMRVDPAKSLQD